MKQRDFVEGKPTVNESVSRTFCVLELVGRPKSRIFGWVFDGVKVKVFGMILFWDGMFFFWRLQTNLQPGGFNWELENASSPWILGWF